MSKAESKAEAKAEILKTGHWTDLYDAVRNPLFETSDDSSDEDEEQDQGDLCRSPGFYFDLNFILRKF